MSIPSAEEQILFLRKFRRLLDEGGFVASYKFALLRSLADLAVLHGDDTDAPLTLGTDRIAARFIELYWRQAAPFVTVGSHESAVLRQNTGRQAAVINTLVEARARAGHSLPRIQRDPAAWADLVRRVDRTVRAMPLWKLQTIGRETLDFLYPNVGSGTRITLERGVAYCLRTFHSLITDLVQAAWVRYVRRTNGKALGESLDLAGFLFGTERAHLAPVGTVLSDVQRGLCFYCMCKVSRAGHVDHFIPWARYPADLGSNLVWAHAACNGAKSDHLAAERHLEHWVSLHRERGAELGERFGALSLTYDLGAAHQVARWAYAQVAVAGGQVWRRGKELERLAATWERVFAA